MGNSAGPNKAASLVLGFGVIMLLLVAIVVTAFSTLSRIEKSQGNLDQIGSQLPAEVMRVRNNINRQRVAMRDILLLSDRAAWKKPQAEIRELSASNDQIMKRLLANSPNGAFHSELQEIDSIRKTMETTRQTVAIPLILAGKLEQAKAVSLGIQSERMARLRAIAEQVDQQASQQAVQRTQQVGAEVERAANLFYGVLGICTLLMLATMAFVYRQVTARTA